MSQPRGCRLRVAERAVGADHPLGNSVGAIGWPQLTAALSGGWCGHRSGVLHDLGRGPSLPGYS